MIMCVLLCYPVSIRIYYQQGGRFLVVICKIEKHLKLMYPGCSINDAQNILHFRQILCKVSAKSPVQNIHAISY